MERGVVPFCSKKERERSLEKKKIIEKEKEGEKKRGYPLYKLNVQKNVYKKNAKKEKKRMKDYPLNLREKKE